MKKLGLFLAVVTLMAMLCVPALAFEKVDVGGTNFETDVIFRAKIKTFVEQLSFTELAITDALNNGRQIHWQFTATSIEDGEQLQGIQLRASWGGTADETGAGITGIEIKARASSDSITHTLGQARAIVANVDCKKSTFTIGYGVESQFDLSAGGEITTAVAFRASLNNSGTVGTGYAYLVETASTANNWDYGLYIGNNQTDMGIYIGETAEWGIRMATTTGGAIRIDRSACDGTTLHIHSHQTESGVEVANDFKGEFLSATGLMDGIRCQYTLDVSSTGTLRTIVANAYLGSTATLSSSGMLYGLLAGVNVVGTVDGSGVEIAAVSAGIMNMIGGTLTEAKYTSAISLSNLATQFPATGESQFIVMYQPANAAVIDQAIFIFGGDRITEFVHFDDTAGMCVTDTDSPAANATHKIKCSLDGVTFYLAGFADF